MAGRWRLPAWGVAAAVLVVLPGVAILGVLAAARARAGAFEARWRAEVAEMLAPRVRAARLPWIAARPGNGADAYVSIVAEIQPRMALGPRFTIGGLADYEQQYEAQRDAVAPTLTALSPRLEAILIANQAAFDRLPEALGSECAWPPQTFFAAATWHGFVDSWTAEALVVRRLLLSDARRLAARGEARRAVRRAAEACAFADDCAPIDLRMNPGLIDVVAHEHDDIEAAREALAAARVLAATAPGVVDVLRRNRLGTAAATALLNLGRAPEIGGREVVWSRRRLKLSFGYPTVEARAREVEAAAAAGPWCDVAPRVAALTARYDSGVTWLVTESDLPDTRYAWRVWLEIAVRRGLALHACAARLFRIETGALPERAEDLVPRYLEAIPVDPSTGRPFVWRRDPAAGDLTIEAAIDDRAVPIPLSMTVAAPKRR